MSDYLNPVFANFPEIETERLLLRELLPEDAPAIFRLFSDPLVTRYSDLET
jgi:ribosomal-protein-alanine N-acetyltransferase